MTNIWYHTEEGMNSFGLTNQIYRLKIPYIYEEKNKLFEREKKVNSD